MGTKRRARGRTTKRAAGVGALLEAAENDDLDAIRAASDGDIARGGAELLVKSMHRRGAAFRELLKRGVSMDVKPRTFGPIHYAAFRARKAQLKKLISLGMDVNVPDDKAMTPLHHAGANIETVRALLKSGADPNAVDRFGRTPLHTATRHLSSSSLGVVKALLKAGADPTKKTRKRKSVAEEMRAFAESKSKVPHSKQAKKHAASIVVVLGATPQSSGAKKQTTKKRPAKKATKD